jgi:hypothetical protein
MIDEPSASEDFYGRALECAIRKGEKHPEIVAALMAQIAEALVDAVAPRRLDWPES